MDGWPDRIESLDTADFLLSLQTDDMRPAGQGFMPGHRAPHAASREPDRWIQLKALRPFGPIRRKMTRGGQVSLTLVVAATLWAGGCATRGAVPRPFPTPAGREGRPADPAPLPGSETTALLGTALSVLGAPYRAGGDSPSTGFDCSGFVAWVFRRHGLEIPRTVTAQFTAGVPIGRADGPWPADLVFFETARGPSHVGIALGNGRFVHAPSGRGVVRIEPLDSPYWSRRYLGARRIVEPSPAGTEVEADGADPPVSPKGQAPR
jgi:cell wall-associated NlpC family hydrolase